MRKSTLTINKKALYDCALLINKGYSLPVTLEILGNYDELIDQLKHGKNIQDYIDFQSKDPFYRHLSFFLSISSFDNAIISAFEYDEMKRKLKENWIKEISYPLFVLLFALVVFFIFDFMIYPQLQSIIPTASTNYLHTFLAVLIGIIWILLILFIFFISVIKIIQKKNYSQYLQYYDKIFSQLSFIKKYISYDFALHTLILMKRGYSTKQVFESLMQLKDHQLLSFDLDKMVEDFKQGKEMSKIIDQQSHFDSKFKYFFKMGYYTNNLENALQDYCEYQAKEFKHILKKSSKIISCVAYSFIGILVISIYQLLLLPLDMMNQF